MKDINWMPVDSAPIGLEVLGFNPEWIDEDYNKDGICMCWKDDEENWTIAKWCGLHDTYHNRISGTIQQEFGLIVNAPTHWIHKPKNPQ